MRDFLAFLSACVLHLKWAKPTTIPSVLAKFHKNVKLFAP